MKNIGYGVEAYVKYMIRFYSEHFQDGDGVTVTNTVSKLP